MLAALEPTAASKSSHEPNATVIRTVNRLPFESQMSAEKQCTGGPCWNRTNNLLIKSQVLCLVELTAHLKLRMELLSKLCCFLSGLIRVVNFEFKKNMT